MYGKCLVFALAGVLVLSGPLDATAQEFPVKPVRIIVPGPAAGGADVVARAMGVHMAELLGQQVVIENRPGANGQIATELVSKAPPDGYTVILGTASAFSLNPSLGPVPYDPIRSFSPVSMVATSPLLLVVHPSIPVRMVGDLIKLAKSRPGQLLYASNGAGSLSHLTTELFSSQAGIELVHVPYKGGTPAVIDTVTGQVSLVITALPTLMTQVRAGRVRPVAVTGTSRVSALPDVPTVSEGGLTGFSSVQWYAMFAPAGTPQGAGQRLNGVVSKVVEAVEMKTLFAREGLEGAGSTPGDLGAFLAADLAKWGKVVKAIQVKRD
ncbi:MAG: tripartite tricarboxylate transporter substrate binding protein [Burkholderiales bacterium]|nr:tripartite tricarboxylate transporter substrate binding protein [Burkholderiales bacterium]